MPRVTVVCVLKSGGVYTPDWAAKLRAGVSRNMSRDHEFICLSDMVVHGVETRPLRQGWKGWWSKIELFEKSRFSGPVLYLDLDCIIVGPLDHLVCEDGFTMCSDFLKPQDKNSSVMSWCGDFSDLHDTFKARRDEVIHTFDRVRPKSRIGDQAFTQLTLGALGHTIKTFPDGAVLSYRQRCRGKRPDNASVVAFHGRPKPPEAHGWAKLEWDSL